MDVGESLMVFEVFGTGVDTGFFKGAGMAGTLGLQNQCGMFQNCCNSHIGT